MQSFEMSFGELVNRYDDDNALFEAYFCEQLNIRPEGVFAVEDGEQIVTDDAYSILEQLYGDKCFVVQPWDDSIKFNGKLNSDFRIMLAE